MTRTRTPDYVFDEKITSMMFTILSTYRANEDCRGQKKRAYRVRQTNDSMRLNILQRPVIQAHMSIYVTPSRLSLDHDITIRPEDTVHNTRVQLCYRYTLSIMHYEVSGVYGSGLLTGCTHNIKYDHKKRKYSHSHLFRQTRSTDFSKSLKVAF